MVETYDHLLLKKEDGGHWVSLNIKKEAIDTAPDVNRTTNQ
jgi:hypothetical protein